MTTSRLIIEHLPDIQAAAQQGRVLDLACGNGRNGIFLSANGISVVFADRDQQRLDTIAGQLAPGHGASFWPLNLERPEQSDPLQGQSFACILVFRYLHRPLMPAIKNATLPGGLVLYETFTVDQPRFGRPHNPDYLLQPGELAACFDDWEIVESFEGVTLSETSGREQAVAQIVARRPASG